MYIFMPCLQHSKKITINHPALRTGLGYIVLAGLREDNLTALRAGGDRKVMGCFKYKKVIWVCSDAVPACAGN